jgi:multidrug efflux pump subunit AcrB
VLALFLDLRLAFWASLGIPTSFAGAFLLFPAFGVSINMISLFALIITLGIVVDDAIVVGENIYDKLQAGMAPLRAAIEGAREMVVPVTFSILTTFAAFAPLLAVPGTSGKIFRIIPIVVISVLAISLVESFLVLPNHLSHGAPTTGPAAAVLRAAEGTRVFVAAALERFSARVYTPLLHAALSARYLTVAVSSALFMAAAGMAASGLLPFTFLPKVEADTVRVTARLPYGVPIETTEEVRARVEAGLQAALREVGASDEVKGVLTLVGQGPLQFGPGAGARPVGSHLLSVEVDLVPIDARDFTTVALADAWERNLGPIPGLQALSFSYSTGPSGGKAVDVQLAHNDTEVLAAASLEVEEALRAYDDLNNIDNTFAAGKPQLDFSLRPEARGLGLTAAEVARQVRAAFFGAEALREQRGRSELKVMVRLPDAERSSEHDLGALEIRGPAGGWAPLDAVAAATRGQAATEIRRESGRRVVDVTAELKAGVKSARPVLEKLEANVLPALREKYPGLSARFAGEQESQNESFDALGRNYLFALFIIYALLAIPFKSYTQPFVIMAAIPFGFVGAVGGHVLHGFEMSIISVMGIIALSGVVVNDSIVLMDAINGYRRDGLTVAEAVVLAGQRRLRPILLTSLTTFFGLMPMIFEKSVQARFLIPMALSLGYGVLFGTFIALVIVPSLYLILEDVIRLATARKAVVMPPLPADGAMASVAGSGADVPDDLGLPAP